VSLLSLGSSRNWTRDEGVVGGGRNDKDTENQRWALRGCDFPSLVSSRNQEDIKEPLLPLIFLLPCFKLFYKAPSPSLTVHCELGTQSQYSLQSHLGAGAHFLQRKASFVS